jgi:hypothetical protein
VSILTNRDDSLGEERRKLSSGLNRPTTKLEPRSRCKDTHLCVRLLSRRTGRSENAQVDEVERHVAKRETCSAETTHATRMKATGELGLSIRMAASSSYLRPPEERSRETHQQRYQTCTHHRRGREENQDLTSGACHAGGRLRGSVDGARHLPNLSAPSPFQREVRAC